MTCIFLEYPFNTERTEQYGLNGERMANVIVFNPNSTPVANRVLNYLESVNTSYYKDRDDVVINPDIPAGVPLTKLKVSNGLVVELTPAELSAIAAQEAIEAAQGEARLLAESKEFAKTVLDKSEPYGVFLNAYTTVLVQQLNVLRTNAGMNAITKDQVKAAIVAELSS